MKWNIYGMISSTCGFFGSILAMMGGEHDKVFFLMMASLIFAVYENTARKEP